jgi:hypothetical protein
MKSGLTYLPVVVRPRHLLSSESGQNVMYHEQISEGGEGGSAQRLMRLGCSAAAAEERRGRRWRLLTEKSGGYRTSNVRRK